MDRRLALSAVRLFAGRLGIERHRIELALGALQDLQTACPLGVLVLQVLLVVAADLVEAGG